MSEKNDRLYNLRVGITLKENLLLTLIADMEITDEGYEKLNLSST